MNRADVTSIHAWLAGLTEAQVSARPASGVWSPKQVLGHLIDSACNNHARWARISGEDGLTFPTWNQDAWMAVEDWQGRPWAEVLALWHAYNLHLAWFAERLPAAVMTHTARIGTLNGGQPMTFTQLLAHYDTHLHKHLGQIRARVGA